MKIYPADKIRNLTLVGHSGGGKTSLIEAMLFDSKAIDRMGKVTDGNTVSDFDQEEIRRGISINTAYAAVEWKDCKINLIDTPGDFDFLGEQQLGMRVGDLNLLVAGAKDGVSVGAEKAMRLAAGRNQPVALVINRLDEANASFEKTLEAFKEVYGAPIVPLALPILEGEKFVGLVDILAKKGYKFGDKGQMSECPIPAELEAEVEDTLNTLNEQIAESDEALMDKFFEGEAFTEAELKEGLKKAIATRSLMPVFPTAAPLDRGVSFLLDKIVQCFPSADKALPVAVLNEAGEESELAFDANGPMAAFVFKTIVDPFVGRISLFRVVRGTFDPSQPCYNAVKEKDERIGGLFVLRGKKQIAVDKLNAGDIGAVAKLVDTQTNDTLCLKGKNLVVKPVKMPVPCLTLCISPKNRGEEDKIMQGMNKLRDEDLSFEIINDPETHQLLLSGQGDTQLDVLTAKLKGKFGVEAILSEPRVAYRETIRKKVKVQGKHKKQSGGHGQYGDVWIEFEPGEQEGLEFCEAVFGGAVPKNYFPAVEKGLQEAVEHGVLAGYPVVNLKATLVDGSYHDVDSNEMSFKLAARLAYKAGLTQASPVLLEPISAVKVHIPDSYLGDIMGDMSKRRGRILGMGADNIPGFQMVEAEAPQAELAKYATDLKSMTQGRGWFTIEFARYEQAPTEVADKVIAAAQKEEE